MSRVTWACVLMLLVSGVGCTKKIKPRDANTDAFVANPGDTTASTANSGQSTNSATSTPPASKGTGNTNYKAGAGTLGNVRAAARRADAMNELRQLGLFIETIYNTNGKMPSKAEVLSEIAREAPKIKKAIEDGDFILTETRNHEGLWAFEVEADKWGGLVLVTGVVTRASPDEARKLMGK